MQRLALLLFALGLAGAGRAQAAGLNVSPVQVHLTRDASKALITIRNESGETTRYQVEANAWDESPTAGMKLTPTEDVIFFPGLLELKPGETKNVRLGAAVPFGMVEKTYRLFISELPAARKPQAQSVVQVLTRVGIPVFVAPVRQIEGHKLSVKVKPGSADVDVENTGNVHFRVDSVKVDGFEGGGARAFEKQVTGWYVLAGGHKTYAVEIPKDGCHKIRRLVATVSIGPDRSFEQAMDTPDGVCGS